LFVKKVLASAGSGVTAAMDEGSAILTSAGVAGASGLAVATRESGDALALEVEAGVAVSETGVETEADVNPRPFLTRAKADDPANTNNMAATATLTSLPLT
jgi:hypothetical protein